MNMKKLACAALCAVMTVCSMSPVASSAAMARWDVDSDNYFTKDDIITMQDYLLGAHSISESEASAGDINNDGYTDEFDFVRMRRELYSGVRSLKYTGAIDLISDDYKTSAVSSMCDWSTEKPGSAAVVETVAQLSNYLVKYFNSDTIFKYTEKYNSRFFQDNVLVLNTAYQSAGSTPLLEFKSVRFIRGEITVETNALDPYGAANVQSALLIQAAIPKNQYYASGVNWVRNPVEYKYPLAAAALNGCGWNLQAAFNRAAGIPYYGHTADMPQTADVSMEWYANYGFTYGKGNCYVMAAMFCEMALTLGYEAHQISGTVPLAAGGYGPHSWVEVTVNGTVYVCDPDFTNETGRNGYLITYGQSGTWRYNKQTTMS